MTVRIFFLCCLVLLSACAPAPEGFTGLSKAAIQGGEAAPSGSPLARVTVQVGSRGNWHCSGTLLGANLLVTAAHCFDGRGSGRREFQPGFSVRSATGEEREIVDWRIHPDWAAAGRPGAGAVGSGDLAVARFFGGPLADAEAAELLPVDHPLDPGDEVWLAGFGGEQGLGVTHVPVLRRNAGSYEIHLDQRGGRGACRGDSGGPAFVRDGGRFRLWGVTSRADGFTGEDDVCRASVIYSDLRATGDWFSRARAELTGSGK